MDSKHSAGPWHAGCFTDPANKCHCTWILSDGYCGSIATVNVHNGKNIADGGNDSPPLDEARANARLISAAPDLLEAAKAALVQAYGCFHNHYPGDDPSQAAEPVHIAMLRAAIAKAEGTSP